MHPRVRQNDPPDLPTETLEKGAQKADVP